MYYITKVTSETGKKFKVFSEKLQKVHDAQRKLAKAIGFEYWRGCYWLAAGGFSSLIFKSPPDPKIYKKVNGTEWMPKMSSKEGKAIQAKLDSAPTVEIKELNNCIGFNGAPFKKIGFNNDNKGYFGFVVREEWNVKVPEDCEEVTTSKFNSLFKTK